MRPLPIFLALAFAALPAAAIVPKLPAGKPHATHKAKVPVTPSVTLAEGKAAIDLRFDQPAQEVVLGVRGLDGLLVTWAPTVEKRAFARGETLHLDVEFTPGPGQSHLAVDVEGSFRGMRKAGVFTFAVGKPSPEQLKAASAGILTTKDGQRIKVMPVKKE